MRTLEQIILGELSLQETYDRRQHELEEQYENYLAAIALLCKYPNDNVVINQERELLKTELLKFVRNTGHQYKEKIKLLDEPGYFYVDMDFFSETVHYWVPSKRFSFLGRHYSLGRVPNLEKVRQRIKRKIDNEKLQATQLGNPTSDA